MNLFIESPNRAMIQRSGVSISYAFVSALGDDRYGFVALAVSTASEKIKTRPNIFIFV